MLVRQCMSEDVRVVAPQMPLKEAAAIMRDQDTGFLPVGENDRLVGSLTDRDIAIRAVSAGMDPNSATVRDAMSDKIFWCFEDQSTDEAADIMGEHQVRRLAVLNHDKRLVGVLSLGDFAQASEGEAARALGDVSRDTGQPRQM